MKVEWIGIALGIVWAGYWLGRAWYRVFQMIGRRRKALQQVPAPRKRLVELSGGGVYDGRRLVLIDPSNVIIIPHTITKPAVVYGTDEEPRDTHKIIQKRFDYKETYMIPFMDEVSRERFLEMALKVGMDPETAKAIAEYGTEVMVYEYKETT